MTAIQLLWILGAAFAFVTFLLANLAVHDAGARMEEIRKVEWAKEHARYNALVEEYLVNMDGVT